MNCVWCGTKGGWLNGLYVHLSIDGGGIVECEWCMKQKTLDGIKEFNENKGDLK